MHEAELFIALLVAVVLVALAARRFERIPHTVALVVGGIVAGLLPFAPELELDHEVIFVVFLPPILYPASFAFAAEDVRANLRPIAFLAFGLVLATVGAVAVVVHLVTGIAWSAAFVLGAVLAPTDPIAATAVIRSTGAPSRLATILEGESLINDGTALTVLKVAIAATAGGFSAPSALGEFALVAAGGAAIGGALGWLVSHLRRRLDELELESAIGVLLAYGAFVAAERAGVSGVLAVVVAGYVMGRSEDIASAGTRMGGESFWKVGSFLAESILFLLVGLAFAQLLDDSATRGAGELAGITALVVAVLVGTRFAWMFTVPRVAGLLDPGTRRFESLVGGRERAVIAFAGLRGALSMAAALSIPAVVEGQEFPERTTVVAIAIAAVIVSLIVPALGLPAVLRAAGLEGAEDAAERERALRSALAEAALDRLERVAAEDDMPGRAVERVREHHEFQLARNRDSPADTDGSDGTDAYRRLWSETVRAQRERLAELHRAGEVHGELLRTVERDLDVQELRRG